jgi:hypothetical protein
MEIGDDISEDMAATAVAEPSTQVERKARIAINGVGTSLIPRTDAGSSTARIRVTATPRPTAGRRPPSIYRCRQNTAAQARQIAEPRHERTLSAVAPDRLAKRFLTPMLLRRTSLLFVLRQSRRLVIVQFLAYDAKQDRALRVAGDQHAVVK